MARQQGRHVTPTHDCHSVSVSPRSESVNARERLLNSVGDDTSDHEGAAPHLTVPCPNEEPSLTEALIETEVKGAAGLPKPDKSAGSDGIVDEFLSTRQRVLSHLSLRMYHYLSDLQKLGRPEMVKAYVETLAKHGRVQLFRCGAKEIVSVMPSTMLTIRAAREPKG
jgi:hypothetical protein